MKAGVHFNITLFIFLCFLLLTDFDQVATSQPSALEFEMKEQTFAYSPVDTTREVTIEFRYPKFASQSELADDLNRFILERLSATILYDSPTTLKASADSLIDRYKQLVAQFKKDVFPWQHQSEIQVIYQSPDILSLEQETYSYTGGAHGLYFFNLYSISKSTRLPLTIKDLLNSRNDITFLQKAESLFRETVSVSPSQSLNDSGFWFAEDKFSLPENCALVKDGILLIYNPYEVASFAQGAIRLIVPLETLKTDQ